MEEIKKIWDDMAADYDGFTGDPASYSNAIEWAGVRPLLPELEGRRVLDLGCGSGRFTYYFQRYRPGELVGLDFSGEMLSLAQSRMGSAPGLRFEKGNAEDLSGFAPAYFDFVFSSTTMHFIEDLEKAFKEAFRVLKPDGDLILSLIHPIYSATYPLPGSKDWMLRYQDRRMREYIQPWTRFNNKDEKTLCRSYHHTLADYLNTLIKCGFSIRGVHEPQPPEEWKENNAKRYNQVMNEPIYLVIVCKRL